MKNMKKTILKLTTLAFIFVMLAGTTFAFARASYSKNFTFNFAYGVVGSTKFELENMYTEMSGCADTYKYELDEDGNYIWVSDSKEYKFTLNSNAWFGKNYETDWFIADGTWQTESFSEVDARTTYTVDVDCKEKLGSMNRRIKGIGTVSQ